MGLSFLDSCLIIHSTNKKHVLSQRRDFPITNCTSRSDCKCCPYTNNSVLAQHCPPHLSWRQELIVGCPWNLPKLPRFVVAMTHALWQGYAPPPLVAILPQHDFGTHWSHVAEEGRVDSKKHQELPDISLLRRPFQKRASILQAMHNYWESFFSCSAGVCIEPWTFFKKFISVENNQEFLNVLLTGYIEKGTLWRSLSTG